MAAVGAGDGVRAAVWLHLDVAAPPRIHMTPGEYSSRDALASLAVRGSGVDLYMVGDPSQLRRWARRVIGLADVMAAEVPGDER
jgi:hypothetical protein